MRSVQNLGQKRFTLQERMARTGEKAQCECSLRWATSGVLHGTHEVMRQHSALKEELNIHSNRCAP